MTLSTTVDEAQLQPSYARSEGWNGGPIRADIVTIAGQPGLGGSHDGGRQWLAMQHSVSLVVPQPDSSHSLAVVVQELNLDSLGRLSILLRRQPAHEVPLLSHL
jgi:hypothetical protein